MYILTFNILTLAAGSWTKFSLTNISTPLLLACFAKLLVVCNRYTHVNNHVSHK